MDKNRREKGSFGCEGSHEGSHGQLEVTQGVTVLCHIVSSQEPPRVKALLRLFYS